VPRCFNSAMRLCSSSSVVFFVGVFIVGFSHENKYLPAEGFISVLILFKSDSEDSFDSFREGIVHPLTICLHETFGSFRSVGYGPTTMCLLIRQSGITRSLLPRDSPCQRHSLSSRPIRHAPTVRELFSPPTGRSITVRQRNSNVRENGIAPFFLTANVGSKAVEPLTNWFNSGSR
jgi:hypothetical protein